MDLAYIELATRQRPLRRMAESLPAIFSLEPLSILNHNVILPGKSLGIRSMLGFDSLNQLEMFWSQLYLLKELEKLIRLILNWPLFLLPVLCHVRLIFRGIWTVYNGFSLASIVLILA